MTYKNIHKRTDKRLDRQTDIQQNIYSVAQKSEPLSRIIIKSY